MDYFEGLFDDEDSGTSRKKRRTDSPEDAVRRVAADRGYNPDFLLGLAQLETRGGAATIKSGGQDTNNLFNVKDFSRAGTGLRGFDKAEGSNDRYRQYASYDESAEDLIGLLDRKYPGAREAQDPVQFAQALKDGGYATDPLYVDKLSRTISSRSKSAAPADRAADPSGYFADLPDDLASALSPPQRRAPAKEPVADKPWWDDAQAVGGQIAAGFAVDAPRMVGQALRFVSPDGSVLDEAGRSAVDAADARAPNWEPDYEGRGALAKTLMMGGRGIGPMTGAIAATMAGGPLAGGAAAAVQFGLGSAQDTHDKITLQGGTEEAAMAAALRVGAVQGLGEGAAAAVGGMALKGLRPLLGGAGATTASVASRMTDTAVLKPLAKGMGLNLLVQPSTEVGQDVSTEFIERAYGAAPEDAWQIAKDSAQGGLGLTLLLGPFAAGGQIRRAQRAEQIKQALYDPNTPDAVRAQVRDMVVQAAAQEGVAAENSDAWLDEQFAAEDAARAQGELADARRSARTYETRNRQDTNEIIELARQQVAPLGEVPDSPTAGVATPQAAEAIQQNQAAALAQQEVEAAQDQEQRAIVETARAEEAEAAKTPQQRAMEQAQAETEALNQQAQALAVEYGVQEVKAAPNVIKEMLRAGDAVSPELAGQVIGELKAGDAPAARKVVVQAIKAREKAQADANKARIKAETEARKAQEKAQKAEQKIVEEGQKAEQANDDYAASVVATRQPEAQVENSVVQNPPQPSPAPQGTTAVSQPAAQAPVVGAQPTGPAPGVPAARPAAVEAAGVTPAEKTPGQKLVEALEARAGKPIPEKVRRRLFLLAGLDPDQGFMVGSPRTLDQVAAIEAAMAGSSKAVSREAIRKSLAPYGINKEAMDRLGGMVQSEESASNTEVDEEGALVETVAPEDNTPATQDEAFGAATEDNRGGTSSMQVRSNLGSGIVEPELTREQKTAALGADKLLAAAAGAITKRGADAIERVKAAVAEATTPVVSAEQIAKNAEITAANEKLIAEMNEQAARGSALNNELGHPDLIAEAPRAAEEWASIGVPEDGDLNWDALPPKQQAAWVRAFARWDNGVDNDSAYYRNFAEINDAARKNVAGRTSAEGAGAGTGDAGAVGERSEAGKNTTGRAPGAAGAVQPTGVRAGDPGQEGPGGERNAAAINREVLDAAEVPLNQEVVESARFSRGGRTLPGQLDKSGQVVGVVSKTLADMERTPSVKEVLDRYRKRGLEHVLDTVQDWYTTSSKVDWSGAYTTVDGRTAMVLPIRTLLFPSMVEQTIDHEIGHAVDLIEAGGLFSGLPEFNLRIAGDKVRAHGDVANELVSHFETEPTSQLSQLLKYPLDRTKYGDLDAQAIREELFAQVWAAWSTPMGRDFIVDNLPDTAYFMEKVDEEIRQDEYRAKVVALSANGGAQASPGPVRFNRAQAVLPPSAARGAGDAASVLRAGQQQVTLSRTPKASQVQRAIAQLPQATRAPVRISMETLGGWANKALDRVVFTGDLIDRAVTQGMKAAKKLESVLADRAHAVRELEYKVSGIMDMYARVPDADRGNGPNSLNQFLFDSTRSSKWGYGKDADPEMAERFEKLSPESQDLVRAIFDHGAQVLADKKKMVLEYTAHEYDAEIAYAKANPDVVSAKDLANLLASKEADLAKFKTLFALREGKPYAPIKRLGTHAVVAKSTEYREAEENADGKRLRELEQDDNHYHVTFVESAHQGRLLRERLLNEGFFGDDPNAVGLFERDKFSDELFGGESMLGALTKLRTKVDSAAGADAGDAKVAAARAKMRTMVSELYLQALAEGSARKSEMRRRGIAGEVDMLRSFAHQGRADATFMASVVSNPQAQEAIQAMREQSRRNGDTLRKSELFNEIMARYLGTMEVEHSPLLNKLTRLTSIWFLATSPGYYLQNLTQPWMMSLPAMAGRFGWGKSSSALWKAYSELSPVMKGIGLFDQHFDFTKVSEKYRPAILELARRGRLDIGMETEMGEFRMEGHGAFTDRWNKVDKGMRLMVQKGEAINRLSTAVAAYELYIENNPNAKYEDAVNYAERVLTDTHGNYDRFSAPRAFNNKLGKVMLQFRKFQLVQLSFYGRLINDAWQGKDRAMAIKTMAYSLLHTGAMAGVMGLPGYAAVAWAMGMMAGDDDEKFDLTYELRKMIGDEALATMILRGAPAAGGVDLSGKIGSGNMLSAMPFSDADITNPKGAAETLGTAVGGASLGLASRVLDGIGLMMAGDWYKGIERTMPKGVSDAMAAYRIASDGMTRRNGDVILPAEDMAEVSAIVKALGLMPTKQAVVYERRDRAFKTEEHLKNRSTRIKNEYIKAVKDGDAAGRTEAMGAWRKLQETRRESGFRIQPMSDLIKAPMAQAKRERDTRNGVQFNRSSRGYAEEMTEQ